jgi:hypothetical protein
MTDRPYGGGECIGTGRLAWQIRGQPSSIMEGRCPECSAWYPVTEDSHLGLNPYRMTSHQVERSKSAAEVLSEELSERRSVELAEFRYLQKQVERLTLELQAWRSFDACQAALAYRSRVNGRIIVTVIPITGDECIVQFGGAVTDAKYSQIDERRVLLANDGSWREL